MKAFLKFIKSLIPSGETWKDIEIVKEEAPTILIGWNIKGEGVDSILVNGDAIVSYKANTNTVEVLDQEATITTRIFTKVNNILKKTDNNVISKEKFSEWEQRIIDAQGSGQKTYKAKRFPKK